MKHPKFEIFEGKDGQFYFRLTAPNGEPILASEGYTAKASCKNGIQSVKNNAPDDGRYKRMETSDDKFSFNLLAKNNEVIGTGQTYASKQGRENGIQSVMENAPRAAIEDTTV